MCQQQSTYKFQHINYIEKEVLNFPRIDEEFYQIIHCEIISSSAPTKIENLFNFLVISGIHACLFFCIFCKKGNTKNLINVIYYLVAPPLVATHL